MTTLTNAPRIISKTPLSFDKDVENSIQYNRRMLKDDEDNNYATNTIEETIEKKKRKGKKNVIFIMTDDLRPSLSLYNVPGVRTPNFERLGKLSTTFSRAYNQGMFLYIL